MADPRIAAHHGPDGRFRNPWPELSRAPGARGVLRWMLRRLVTPRAPDPGLPELPAEEPDLARPRAGPRELRITWVGHSTFIVQLPGLTLLTDPVWGRRASPFRRVGPARFVPPVPALEDLPPVDAVLLSHDHFDHLDRPTVEALRESHGEDLLWLTPLGFRRWFDDRGVHVVRECDWWQEAELGGGGYRAVCLPARHWTRRSPGGTNRRLWASWAVVPSREGDRRPRVYFGGDSGYGPAFREVGASLGPFDASILPIGAYEPRWFMEPSHMNPEEAVRAFRDLGARGAFVASHWGTFRLADEPPLEPPVRVRDAWRKEGLPETDLHVLRHGETAVLDAAALKQLRRS